VLVSGDGAILRDSEGREYIDGNSSIWTNLHGHNHPVLNAALRSQLDRVAHTSFLGFTNPPAIELAADLAALWPPDTLTRVFYSDDGSTAVEVAIKMVVQYWQLVGEPQRELFIGFSDAYHGDTMGASSLGGVGAFHDRFQGFHFPVQRVSSIAEIENLGSAAIAHTAAVIIEPLIQGAAGMKLWPAGMLSALRAWCDRHGVLLIADEVMTGFGRTGAMFACEKEKVVPDLLALAKGLTGGYLPLAATLTTERFFNAFLGRYEDLKTFFYGHSYTANQLGCAVGLANLRLFREEKIIENLGPKVRQFSSALDRLREAPHVAEIRQCGLIAGIELRKDRTEPFDWRLQAGARVCLAARKHGLLTRPIRDVIVLMPPYCITADQIERTVSALVLALEGLQTSDLNA
jgi:adenosylmethionine-8-amino-7-oxononanoate aminotransferase